MSKIAEVDCYVSKPSDYPQTAAKLLLLLSSGTGVHSKNNQIQADRFAAEGYLVVMPDQCGPWILALQSECLTPPRFNNDPAPATRQTDLDLTNPPASPSTIEAIKLGIAQTLHTASTTFQVDMWLARQTPEKCLPLLRRVIAAVEQEFADAVAHGGGIYAVGYCFGARYVLLLGGQDAGKPAAGKSGAAAEEGQPLNKQTLIKAGAMAHGTQVQVHDMAQCRAPVLLQCVTEDPWFPDEIREAGKKHMEVQGTEHELTMYPGVPHGFAVVGEYDDQTIKEAQSKAFGQMLQWLEAH